MTQQLVLKPLGIISQPNKLGTIPQGALQFADQCYMRQPGMIENANRYNTVSPSIGSLGTSPGFVTQVDSQFVLITFKDSGVAKTAFVDTNAVSITGLQNFADESAATQTLDFTGLFTTTINRNRVLFTAANGTFVRDLPTHGAMRSAGLPQPYITGVAPNGTGNALPSNTHAIYTAIFIRRFADGYEMISVPALANEVINTSGTTQQILIAVSFVSAANQGYTVAGDIVQIYRTKSQTYNSSTSTFTNTGSDYLLVTEYTLNSTDITNGQIQYTDNISDGALGEALYTNAGVKTQDGLAFPSPTAKVICTFKGYTFFFNRIDPPKASLRAPVWWEYMGDSASGASAAVRQYGIGQRVVHGNSTSGNPTLTSVPAGDVIGIVKGQLIVGSSPYGGPTHVVSTTATSITFDRNASSTTTGTSFQIDDVLELNGTQFSGSTSFNVASAINNTLGSNACAICLNLILPTSGNTFPPNAVPAQSVDITYLRLSDQTPSFTVRATNGANYVPQLPRIELSEAAKSFASTTVRNGVTWSEQGQPENCPPLNTAFVGSGEVYAAYPTRDAVWIFASDGLWRLSGTGGSAGPEGFDWRIDPVDSTLIIAGPQAGCVLRDMVFAYTNRGLVQISSDGTIRELTLGRLDDRLPGPPWSTPNYTAANAVFLIADETNDEIWMKDPVTPGNRVWIYNYINDAFTNDFIGNSTLAGNAPVHGCYSRFKQAVIFLDPTTATLVTPNNSASRKSFDFKFQTLLGDDPFTTRMWQQCEISCYLPDHDGLSHGIQLFANGDTTAPFANTLGLNCGSQSLKALAASKADAKFYRASWSIPRNAPSVAYTFAPELFGGGSTVCYFQGLAVKFIDLTEQRADR